MAVATANKLITEWAADSDFSQIIQIEKSVDGRVTIEEISAALTEYKSLLKAGYASPAMILTLSRAFPENPLYQEIVKERNLLEDDPTVVGGPASVEMIDHEGHLITSNALSKAFDKYMENPMTRNVMVMHSDIQVGWALPAYIGRGGQVYKAGMTDKTLFFISELRKDTKISKKVIEQINKSKMKSYSIAGSAIKTENVPGNLLKGENPYMRVDELELAEVTICERGVNQGASFDLIKSHNHPNKSCADGSCLITKENKGVQQTKTMSFQDYKAMLNDKEGKSFVEMFKEYTDLNKARSKSQQAKGLRRQTGDASRWDEAEHSYEATSPWHTGQPGGVSEEEAGFKSKTAAQHKATDRMHNKPTKAPDMDQRLANHKRDKETMDKYPGHYLHNTPRGKKYAESKAVQKAVWEAFGMDVEKARRKKPWWQPSSEDKPNTQARKKGLIRGVPEKAGDAAKKSSPKPHQVESDPISGQDDKEFQQKEFVMNDAELNNEIKKAVREAFGLEEYTELNKGIGTTIKNKASKFANRSDRKDRKKMLDHVRSPERNKALAAGSPKTTPKELSQIKRAGTKAYNKSRSKDIQADTKTAGSWIAQGENKKHREIGEAKKKPTPTSPPSKSLGEANAKLQKSIIDIALEVFAKSGDQGPANGLQQEGNPSPVRKAVLEAFGLDVEKGVADAAKKVAGAVGKGAKAAYKVADYDMSKLGKKESGFRSSAPKLDVEKGIKDAAKKAGGAALEGAKKVVDAANYDMSKLGKKESGKPDRKDYIWSKQNRRKSLGGDG